LKIIAYGKTIFSSAIYINKPTKKNKKKERKVFMDNNKLKQAALGGIKQNPVFVLVLGMCATLAITGTVKSALGMGAAVLFVLLFSNVIISALRNVIPDKVRIPAYIMIIATLVTIVEMVMHKFIPDLYKSLGIYLSLVVVNCIILARAEGFAKSNGVLLSLIDGLSIGLGFLAALLVMSLFRELLGAGTIYGIKIMDFKIEFFGKAGGAFLTLGLLMGAFNAIYKSATTKRTKGCCDEPAAKIETGAADGAGAGGADVGANNAAKNIGTGGAK
jgi:electron transport complex protein RnfE